MGRPLTVAALMAHNPGMYQEEAELIVPALQGFLAALQEGEGSVVPPFVTVARQHVATIMSLAASGLGLVAVEVDAPEKIDAPVIQ